MGQLGAFAAKALPQNCARGRSEVSRGIALRRSRYSGEPGDRGWSRSYGDGGQV